MPGKAIINNVSSMLGKRSVRHAWPRYTVGYQPPESFFEYFGGESMALEEVEFVAGLWLQKYNAHIAAGDNGHLSPAEWGEIHGAWHIQFHHKPFEE